MAISGGDALLGKAAVLLGAEVDPNFARDAEKGILGPLQSLTTKITHLLVGAFAAHELFSFFKESTRAAIENEKSIKLLEYSFKALGVAEEDQKGAEKWIATMSKARGVLEDQLRPALSQALRFTGDLAKAEDLLGLAQDIAIARGKDLGAVVTALGRASTGNVQLLGRLGLAVKDTSGHVLSAAEAFKKLHEQFGGAGLAAMDTADGRSRALGVSFHELKVQVGDLLLPVLLRIGDILMTDVIPPIRSVIKWLGDVNGALDGWGGKILLTITSIAALVFTIQKLIAIGAAVRLFLLATIDQMSGAAFAARIYAGSLTTLSASFTAAVVAAGPLIIAIGILVAANKLLGDGLPHLKGWVDGMDRMTSVDLVAYLKKMNGELDHSNSVWGRVSGQLTNVFHSSENVHDAFEKILKQTPQFAQTFLDAATKAGINTKGWKGEIDATVESIKKANATTQDFNASIDDTATAMADVVTQTGAQAIALAQAGVAAQSYRDAIDAGKKANEDAAKAIADHSKAYDELVTAIGPVGAAITGTGNVTTEQLQKMASDALQFSSDFATAMHDATDPLSFFANETVVTATQLQNFLMQSIAATQAWAANLQYAVAIGLDKGYIQELAKAGPKSAPILQALLDLVSQTSVSATNELLRGVAGAQQISRNLWQGFVADAARAARLIAIELHDVQVQTHAAFSGAAPAGAAPAPPPLLTFPTLKSLGLGASGSSGGGGASAITQATDAVAVSLKQLQDQFKIGEITEQQLADQAGAMWADTEKFSTNWMAIWDILHGNAVHLQDAADKAAKDSQAAADAAAKAAQDAADKAAKAAQDAADKIAAAAAQAAAEYAAAFGEIVDVLGDYGAAAVKARGLSTTQLKAMAAEVRSFQQAVAQSFNSAASAVAAFGNQTEVTGQQLLDFQRQSLKDARDWSQNITKLMRYGLDQSLLKPLAEAGPKAGALVRAYIDEIGLIGVDAVNQMAKDQARILANTTAQLTAGITGTAAGIGGGGVVIHSNLQVTGSVYGVADLNSYMDARDAALAAALAAGQR